MVWDIVVMCVYVCVSGTFSHSGGTRTSQMQWKVSSKLDDITTKPLIPFSSSTRDELTHKHTQLQLLLSFPPFTASQSGSTRITLHSDTEIQTSRLGNWVIVLCGIFYVDPNQALLFCLSCGCQDICIKSAFLHFLLLHHLFLIYIFDA